MKHILVRSALAALLAGASLTAPARAQTAAPAPSGPIIPGLGVANLDAVIANSNAFRTAQQQRVTTYKPQIDQAEARRSAIEAQLQPLVAKFNTDQRAAAPNQAVLTQEAQTIQGIQQSGQQELQRILQPVAQSEAYGNETIGDKVDQAVRQAMIKQKISLLLSPQAVLAANGQAYNLNQAILTEINTLVPSIAVQPPAGWVPREQREQQAAAAQQQGAAPAAASTRPQPQGR